MLTLAKLFIEKNDWPNIQINTILASQKFPWGRTDPKRSSSVFD